MEELSEKTIQEAAKGDMSSFESLYRHTSGLVYSTAYRITMNKADAEEVTQDVFMKVFRNLDKYEEGTSFKSWIYRIAANTAINCYRKKSKEFSRREDFDLTVKTQGIPSPINKKIDNDEDRAQISLLLNMLNPDQRACIIFREIEGLSYQQIAEAMNININTVRSRLRRARETLLSYGRKEVIKNELL